VSTLAHARQLQETAAPAIDLSKVVAAARRVSGVSDTGYCRRRRPFGFRVYIVAPAQIRPAGGMLSAFSDPTVR
jgi:hypothetical protein